MTVPESGASGVIVTQGGSVGGWSLYAHEGRLKYCYNFFGIEYYVVAADEPIPSGAHQVRMEFAYDGGGLGKGGDVTLYYDGKAAGTGRVEQTEPMAFSADEACDVGSDTGSPASPDYGPTGNKFSGTIQSLFGPRTPDVVQELMHGPPRAASGAERATCPHSARTPSTHGRDLTQGAGQPAERPEAPAEQELAFARTQLSTIPRTGRVQPCLDRRRRHSRHRSAVAVLSAPSARIDLVIASRS